MPVEHLLATPNPALIASVLEAKADERSKESHQGLVGFLSQRPSTRTRAAVAAAARRLGFGYLELQWDTFYGNLRIHRLADCNRQSEMRSLALCGIKALVARVHQAELESLASNSPIPVINGCSDLWHPLQVLADLRALRIALGSLEGRSIAFLGNGRSPVARSLVIVAGHVGLEMTVVAPEAYGPEPDVLAASRDPSRVRHMVDPADGLSAVEAVYTDEWFYRTPTEAERKAFGPYRLCRELMDRHAPDAKILHCLPFADEIEPDLLEDPRSLIWNQVAERVPTTTAVLDNLIQSTVR